MWFWFWSVAAFIGGGILGFMIAAILAAAKD